MHQKKFRDTAGTFLVEGEKQVQELLNSDYKVLDIYATSDWHGTMDHTVVSNGELERLTTVKSSNNVVAVAYQKKFETLSDSGLILALDGIRDPGNMGTLIRSAVWFGVKEIWCSTDCVEVYNPKVVRSTMGALFKLPVIYTDLVSSIGNFSGVKAGLILGGNDQIRGIHKSDCLLVLGNESNGITDEVQNCLDLKIEIGGNGKMESLNAAMAGTIVMYEWFRGFEESL